MWWKTKEASARLAGTGIYDDTRHSASCIILLGLKTAVFYSTQHVLHHLYMLFDSACPTRGVISPFRTVSFVCCDRLEGILRAWRGLEEYLAGQQSLDLHKAGHLIRCKIENSLSAPKA